MTRGNERLQFDIFLAPVNISAPGYIMLILSASLYLSSPSLSLTPLSSMSLVFFSPSRSQRGSSDSRSSEELPAQGGYRGLRPSSSGSEEGVQELFEVGVHPQLNPPSLEQSPAHCSGNRAHMMAVQHVVSI